MFKKLTKCFASEKKEFTRLCIKSSHRTLSLKNIPVVTKGLNTIQLAIKTQIQQQRSACPQLSSQIQSSQGRPCNLSFPVKSEKLWQNDQDLHAVFYGVFIGISKILP
jgi:hypothetical protein